MRDKRRSGQIIILTALTIAFIILSTIIYVYQISQNLHLEDQPLYLRGFIGNVKMASRILMMGSLANISNGGENGSLRYNLQRLRSFIESNYQRGRCILSFRLCEVSPYSSGLWIFWGTDGFGVSSAKADFSLNLADEREEIITKYSVNITTHILISATSEREESPGFYVIRVTIRVFNEGSPALCKNLTIYYTDYYGNWHEAGSLNSYSLKDYGNGTYSARFLIFESKRMLNRKVKVLCFDRREIRVIATTTCERI